MTSATITRNCHLEYQEVGILYYISKYFGYYDKPPCDGILHYYAFQIGRINCEGYVMERELSENRKIKKSMHIHDIVDIDSQDSIIFNIKIDGIWKRYAVCASENIHKYWVARIDP